MSSAASTVTPAATAPSTYNAAGPSGSIPSRGPSTSQPQPQTPSKQKIDTGGMPPGRTPATTPRSKEERMRRLAKLQGEQLDLFSTYDWSNADPSKCVQRGSPKKLLLDRQSQPPSPSLPIQALRAWPRLKLRWRTMIPTTISGVRPSPGQLSAGAKGVAPWVSQAPGCRHRFRRRRIACPTLLGHRRSANERIWRTSGYVADPLLNAEGVAR